MLCLKQGILNMKHEPRFTRLLKLLGIEESQLIKYYGYPINFEYPLSGLISLNDI